MPKVKLNLTIGYPGAERNDEEDIDDELWDSLDEREREKLLDELASDWANNYIGFSAMVIE